jgi:hypothetical protein
MVRSEEKRGLSHLLGIIETANRNTSDQAFLLLAAYAPNPAIPIVATTDPIRITDDPVRKYGSAACTV